MGIPIPRNSHTKNKSLDFYKILLDADVVAEVHRSLLEHVLKADEGVRFKPGIFIIVVEYNNKGEKNVPRGCFGNRSVLFGVNDGLKDGV